MTIVGIQAGCSDWRYRHPRRCAGGGGDDHLGGVLEVESFPTTTAGYRRLVGWLHSHGEVTVVGVQGTGSYGVGAAPVSVPGIEVVEVDRPTRSAPATVSPIRTFNIRWAHFVERISEQPLHRR